MSTPSSLASNTDNKTAPPVAPPLTQLSTFPPVEPSSTSTSPSSTLSQWFSHPFNVTWRAALVKAPRLVPIAALKITSPAGPFPFIYEFKSPRGRHAIPLYIWIPESAADPPWPVIVDFHGGGFVLGSCLEQAPFCAQMCRELKAVVISVDYRMGPISKFPAAIWDGEDVLRAILDVESDAGIALRDTIAKKAGKAMDRPSRSQTRAVKKANRKLQLSSTNATDSLLKPTASKTSTLKPTPSRSLSASPNSSINSGTSILDPTRIAISGFSSGGNLALNFGLQIKPPQLPEAWPSVLLPEHEWTVPLLLFYPSFDSRLLPSQRNRPHNLAPGSPFWSEVDDILAPSYLPRDQASHPRASPGLADVKESLHKKVKAFLVLPELDTLAEQSEAWVKKVEEAGRGYDLEVRREKGMKHGWTQFPVSWLSEDEKRSRDEVFRRSVEFVSHNWGSST